MEVGARERFEIGPVDDRIVLEDDRLAHAATHHVLPDREMAGVAADFALAHRAALVAADRGFVDRHARRRSRAGIEEAPGARRLRRAEERRVGKEGGSTCRSWGAAAA